MGVTKCHIIVGIIQVIIHWVFVFENQKIFSKPFNNWSRLYFIMPTYWSKTKSNIYDHYIDYIIQMFYVEKYLLIYCLKLIMNNSKEKQTLAISAHVLNISLINKSFNLWHLWLKYYRILFSYWIPVLSRGLYFFG